ncbi:hypothetical protein [Amycolatopsis suaedae]|uniref:hypothetical protein n=1 Tax=Amycolatopsis suaedae TaxID=2510978 RepID=UPI001F0EBCB0|nr:hypothetical protein [Amycolatopsis suaedae]
MSDEQLRRAAFGDDPGHDPGLGRRTPRARWLAAVVLGAQGRYAAAATALHDLLRDPVFAAHAAATLAAHRRQLGGHAAALRWDALALRLADGTEATDPDGADATGARCDALLGLAADNLGVGRLTAARRLLDAAAAADDRWRARVRHGWVTAEVALASGDAAAAVGPAERAVAEAAGRGAVRHLVKSRLVLAAALAATGETRKAHEMTVDAYGVAEEHGLRSLEWPAALIAADTSPGHAGRYRSRAVATLHALLPHADPVGRWLASESPWLPVSRHTDIWARLSQKKPPDRVKVGPKASDRGSGMSPGCRKETP